jgi:hypothetical protein
VELHIVDRDSLVPSCYAWLSRLLLH